MFGHRSVKRHQGALHEPLHEPGKSCGEIRSCRPECPVHQVHQGIVSECPDHHRPLPHRTAGRKSAGQCKDKPGEEDEREYKILKAHWRLFHKDSADLETARSVYLRGVNEYMTQQNALDLIVKNHPQFEKVYDAYQDVFNALKEKTGRGSLMFWKTTIVRVRTWTQPSPH